MEKNIPAYEGPVVLVQGDTGPGNLMYLDGKVTGIIDWELAHLSDPMDDVAWMCWRTVQHTFTDFAARMREYEALSGHSIDADRVNPVRVDVIERHGVPVERNRRVAGPGRSQQDRVGRQRGGQGAAQAVAGEIEASQGV